MYVFSNFFMLSFAFFEYEFSETKHLYNRPLPSVPPYICRPSRLQQDNTSPWLLIILKLTNRGNSISFEKELSEASTTKEGTTNRLNGNNEE